VCDNLRRCSICSSADVLNHWSPPLSQHIHSNRYTTQRHIRLTHSQPLDSSSVTTHSLSSLHYTATHKTDTHSTTGVLLCHNTFTLIVTLHSDTSDRHALNHWSPPLSQHIHSHRYTTQQHIRLTHSQPLDSSSVTRPVCKGGVTGVVPPLNLSEVKFSGSTFGSCTTVTAQFSSFVHQCGCSQL